MSELTLQPQNPDLLKIQSFVENLQAKWAAIVADSKFLGSTVFRSEQDFEDLPPLTDEELERIAEMENPLPEPTVESSSDT